MPKHTNANLTVTVVGHHGGGNHCQISVDVLISGVTQTVLLSLEREEIFGEIDTLIEPAIRALVRNFAKENNINNLSQLKTQIDGRVFKL